MEKNFRVSDIAVIALDDMEIDLHSDALLETVQIAASDETMKVVFKCTSNALPYSVVEFSFLSVERLLFSASLDTKFPDEATTLNSIGYLPPEEFGRSDSFFMEKDFSPGWHVILCFENTSFIAVEAKSCAVTLGGHVTAH